MWVITGEFDNFSQILNLLNIISDQFVVCKLCIVMYYKFTDHKLVQNFI